MYTVSLCHCTLLHFLSNAVVCSSNEIMHSFVAAIAAGRDAPVRAYSGTVTTVRLSLRRGCLSIIYYYYYYCYSNLLHSLKYRRRKDTGYKMSNLDLDEIYNFTIKLARDVSTITVPHLPPPTFHLSHFSHIPL
jgi:hypothetical protein